MLIFSNIDSWFDSTHHEEGPSFIPSEVEGCGFTLDCASLACALVRLERGTSNPKVNS